MCSYTQQSERLSRRIISASQTEKAETLIPPLDYIVLQILSHMLSVVRVGERQGKKNMIFIESYPNVQHSKIEILAYRAIGVITVNLQHNLPK